MTQEDRKIIRDILDTGNAGYAHVYPLNGGKRKEYMLSLSSENLANFVGTYGFKSEKLIVTDMSDRFVLDTDFWLLNDCPDKQLRRELQIALTPIQMGDWEAGRPLAISRETADEYFQENQQVTMAELAMQ